MLCVSVLTFSAIFSLQLCCLTSIKVLTTLNNLPILFAMSKSKEKTLTEKQRRFCHEYLVDLNATQAAIRTGYSKKTAESQGSRLLTNVEVRKLIDDLKLARAEKLEITKDRVLREIAKSAFSNILDYMEVQPDGTAIVDLSNMTREQAAALGEITVDSYTEGNGEELKDVKRVKIKLNDKGKALDQLGRHLQLFTDRIDLSGAVDIAGFNITFVGAKEGRET